MSKSTDIWFPFYIGDYIADTMHLSAEEHGAYLLLIIHYWKNQKPIKNDPKTLQNIAKIKFKKLSNVLAFFDEKNGEYCHKRIDKEIAKAKENKELKSQAGKKGMEKRYNKPLTGVITENITEPQQNANSSPSPSPSLVTTHTTTRAQIDLEIFDEILKITGGKILDPSPITKWLQAGATKELILQVIKTRNKPQITSLKYFDGMIADAIEYQKQPLITGAKNANKSNIRQYYKPTQGQEAEAAIARLGEKYGINPNEI